MPGPFITPVAQSVPLDNKTVKDNDFTSLNVQDALEEIDFRRETKEPTGMLDRSESTISFDNATRTFSITPTGEKFTYFIRGERFDISTTNTVQITDTEGLWYIYYNSSGALVASQTAWDFELPQVFVAIIYWDSTNKKQIIFGEERHGLVMDWATHKRLHEVTGSQIGKEQFKLFNYIIRGDGSLNSHAQIAVEPGSLYDEDIRIDILDKATPTNGFEQTLSPIAKLPVYYKLGPNGDWRKKDATDYPLYESAGMTPFYNEWTGSTWKLTNVTDKRYITMAVCITNNIFEPVIAVLSQGEHTSIINSIKHIDYERIQFLKGLPFTEIYIKEYLVFECQNAYTNSVKARLVSTIDADDFSENTDRYNIQATYDGDANTGRYLELFPEINSLEAPFLFPEDGYIRNVTVVCADNPGTGKRIGFFEIGNLTTPRFEVTLQNQKRQAFELSELFQKNESMAVKVTHGEIKKPAVRIWVETILTGRGA